MAKKKTGSAKFLILLLFLLIIATLYVFDRLGVINVRERFTSIVYKIPVIGPVLQYREERQIYAFNQLLSEIKKHQASLKEQEDRLQELQAQLKEKEQQLQNKEKQLDKELEEVKKLKEQYKTRLSKIKTYDEKIKQLADLYANMRPQIAVQQLQYLDDFLIVDILNELSSRGEQQKQDVAYLLSLFPAERASRITKKMMLAEKKERAEKF